MPNPIPFPAEDLRISKLVTSRDPIASGVGKLLRLERDRSAKLEELARYGLNVPIYTLITNDDWEKSKHFRKQCAVRFDELGCELPKLPGEVIVVGGRPPLIAHSSPCVAPRLHELLKCRFKAHVTDVTIKDSVGAGITLKTPEGKVIVEAVVGGSVRDISRKGKVDARATLEGNILKVEGNLQGLLAYCAFKSALAALRLPPGALEWSCHRGLYGTKGDHVVFWELIRI